MLKIIGREYEIAELQRLKESKSPELVAVYGRRRVGKTFLIRTFFQNQLSVSHEVNAPHKGDFLVDGRYLFEVGGKNKTFEQIKDVPDSFLAVDETEVGYGNRVPLWLFGLLY